MQNSFSKEHRLKMKYTLFFAKGVNTPKKGVFCRFWKFKIEIFLCLSQI